MPRSWEAAACRVSLLSCYRVDPHPCPTLMWLQKWPQTHRHFSSACKQPPGCTPLRHSPQGSYTGIQPLLEKEKSLETRQGHPQPRCSLGLALHFLRGLRSRFTGGGSRSEGSSGKGLVSFSVLTTGKVKVAELGLMGM